MSDLAIELFGVSKRFGPKVAVSNVSLSVPRGSVFGLIGPNGAGKTTTFSMMCGYLYPTEGSLKVMDVDPATPGALKGRLGALPQDAVLPPGWETGALLTYWARLSALADPEREAREALEQVGLMEAWNVQTQALSHGMAKRAAMGQALMGRPPLVLLDEPTAGLDPRIAAQVRQVIKNMKEARQTVVVSSHNLQELEELCDAAAILDKGKLAQAGTMSELTGQGSEFRVQIARGDVLIPEIAALADVTDARMEGESVLRVRIKGGVKPEEVISHVVGHLLQHGVLILGVSRGQRLEDRVLQLL
ncbi:ABC transporter ATP-binding protein [Pyxidicoccus sp. MSG2]|uniref:ABC transporter ATP-binding protein n=1 Tax=Pyxidicoccus sp. MSG2 TaxID=2996790 RepID=UPI00226FF751|nr:ABC transporter ATP-binding protein [Pyxidicoccus sp. MSG2]MCY1014442.1 ABC transporter ATP-binding protein [Pyxidicoccus sp. MSG2]